MGGGRGGGGGGGRDGGGGGRDDGGGDWEDSVEGGSQFSKETISPGSTGCRTS